MRNFSRYFLQSLTAIAIVGSRIDPGVPRPERVHEEDVRGMRMQTRSFTLFWGTEGKAVVVSLKKGEHVVIELAGVPHEQIVWTFMREHVSTPGMYASVLLGRIPETEPIEVTNDDAWALAEAIFHAFLLFPKSR